MDNAMYGTKTPGLFLLVMFLAVTLWGYLAQVIERAAKSARFQKERSKLSEHLVQMLDKP